MTTRARVLILGYGNTLRGDDGFGRRAAEKLLPLEERADVRVVSAHQLSVDYAEAIADAELVIFVDASREGLPGEVRTTTVEPSADPDGVMTHHLTPESLLRLSKSLFGGSPEAVAITVTGARFEVAESLSPVVAEEIPTVVRVVESLLRKYAERSGPWAPV